MRAVIVGSVESSRVAIEAIARAPDWSLPLVITLPPELAHRHSDYVHLGSAAAAAGAELLSAPNINAPHACEAVEALAPDYVFVIGWSQICRAPFTEACGGELIGYHPSPLPRMRGRAVIPWTILSGDAITGGTLFWIDPGVDTGAILEQRFMHVAADETAATLYRRHMEILSAMMGDALIALALGRPRREPQDERYASWAARRTPESGRIDWTWPACDVARLVRASGRPYPGARTKSAPGKGDLIIWEAQAVAGDRHLATPGQIIERHEASFTVQCGDKSALRIIEWESDATATPPAIHAELGAG